MPKSSKTDSGNKKKGKEIIKAAAPAAATPVAEPVTPAKAKAVKKPEPKKKVKEEAVEKPKKTAKVAKPVVGITNDDIALRAYYIAERRKSMGWAGDSTSDWVEAEQQLRKEAAKKK